MTPYWGHQPTVQQRSADLTTCLLRKCTLYKKLLYCQRSEEHRLTFDGRFLWSDVDERGRFAWLLRRWLGGHGRDVQLDFPRSCQYRPGPNTLLLSVCMPTLTRVSLWPVLRALLCHKYAGNTLQAACRPHIATLTTQSPTCPTTSAVGRPVLACQ